MKRLPVSHISALATWYWTSVRLVAPQPYSRLVTTKVIVRSILSCLFFSGMAIPQAATADVAYVTTTYRCDLAVFDTDLNLQLDCINARVSFVHGAVARASGDSIYTANLSSNSISKKVSGLAFCPYQMPSAKGRP